MIKNSIKNVDSFIAPSMFTIQKHRELGLRMPIVHIPHFFLSPDQEILNCEIERINSTPRPFFLFVGRLEKIKGLQCVIPVFKDYKKADLVIAGDGGYEEALQKMSADINNVRFLGRLNNKELKKLYAKAVAVIIPSICFETFGMTIIEAFAMKTPAIVNNIGPFPEIITVSGGGFIYDNNNDLIKAMDTLISKPEKRKELSENGYYSFKKYWTEESHLKMYFDLISKTRERKQNYDN